MKSADHATVKRTALRLLERGEAHPSEIAKLAGVARMTVFRWAVEAGIDWELAYRDRLTRLWKASERRQSGKRPKKRRTKEQLRKEATAAHRTWLKRKRRGKDRSQQDAAAPPD